MCYIYCYHPQTPNEWMIYPLSWQCAYTHKCWYHENYLPPNVVVLASSRSVVDMALFVLQTTTTLLCLSAHINIFVFIKQWRLIYTWESHFIMHVVAIPMLYTYVSWASCQIRKIAGAHAPGMPGTFSPPSQVSDPDMHHGTCVTHVPWCMPGLLTSGFLRNRRWEKTFPAFPAHAQTAILRIW